MRTNIELDMDIVDNAFKYSKSKTKKGLIREALVEYIAIKKKRNLLDIRGKIKFADGYDYKPLRNS